MDRSEPTKDTSDALALIEELSELYVDQSQLTTDQVLALEDQVSRYQDLIAAIEKGENLVSILKQEKEKLRTGVIPDMMRSLDLVNNDNKGGFRLEDGRLVTLRTYRHASVKAARMPLFLEYCARQGITTSMMKQSIDEQALKAHVKDLDKRIQPIPTVKLEDGTVVPLIDVYTQVVAIVPKRGTQDGEAN